MEKTNWGCLVFLGSFGILLWNYPKAVLGTIAVFILFVMMIDCSGKSSAVELGPQVSAVARLQTTADPNGPTVLLTVTNRSKTDISAYTFHCGKIILEGYNAPAGQTVTASFDPFDYQTTEGFLDIPTSAGTCFLKYAQT